MTPETLAKRPVSIFQETLLNDFWLSEFFTIFTVHFHFYMQTFAPKNSLPDVIYLEF